MDRMLIIQKTNDPRASSAPILGLFSIIFMFIWYIQHISGEHLQDHNGPLVFLSYLLY